MACTAEQNIQLLHNPSMSCLPWECVCEFHGFLDILWMSLHSACLHKVSQSSCTHTKKKTPLSLNQEVTVILETSVCVCLQQLANSKRLQDAISWCVRNIKLEFDSKPKRTPVTKYARWDLGQRGRQAAPC